MRIVIIKQPESNKPLIRFTRIDQSSNWTQKKLEKSLENETIQFTPLEVLSPSTSSEIKQLNNLSTSNPENIVPFYSELYKESSVLLLLGNSFTRNRFNPNLAETNVLRILQTRLLVNINKVNNKDYTIIQYIASLDFYTELIQTRLTFEIFAKTDNLSLLLSKIPETLLTNIFKKHQSLISPKTFDYNNLIQKIQLYKQNKNLELETEIKKIAQTQLKTTKGEVKTIDRKFQELKQSPIFGMAFIQNVTKVLEENKVGIHYVLEQYDISTSEIQTIYDCLNDLITYKNDSIQKVKKVENIVSELEKKTEETISKIDRIPHTPNPKFFPPSTLIYQQNQGIEKRLDDLINKLYSNLLKIISYHHSIESIFTHTFGKGFTINYNRDLRIGLKDIKSIILKIKDDSGSIELAISQIQILLYSLSINFDFQNPETKKKVAGYKETILKIGDNFSICHNSQETTHVTILEIKKLLKQMQDDFRQEIEKYLSETLINERPNYLKLLILTNKLNLKDKNRTQLLTILNTLMTFRNYRVQWEENNSEGLLNAIIGIASEKFKPIIEYFYENINSDKVLKYKDYYLDRLLNVDVFNEFPDLINLISNITHIKDQKSKEEQLEIFKVIENEIFFICYTNALKFDIAKDNTQT